MGDTTHQKKTTKKSKNEQEATEFACDVEEGTGQCPSAHNKQIYSPFGHVGGEEGRGEGEGNMVTLARYCTCSTQYPPQYPIYFCPPTEFLGNSIFFQPIDGVLNGKMSISTSGFAKKNRKKSFDSWMAVVIYFFHSSATPYFPPFNRPVEPPTPAYQVCWVFIVAGVTPPMHPQPLPPHFYFFLAIADHVSTNFCQE